MKPTRLLVVSILALPIAFAGIRVALAKPTPMAQPAAILLAAPDPAFKEKFKKLMEKQQKADMEKLVKSESAAAVLWIVKATEILAERPDDPELGPFSSDLSAAWKTAMKSTFPEKFHEYLAKLEGSNKKERPDLRRRFDKALSEFEGNSEKKDNEVYTQLLPELDVLGSAFEEIGDHYFASETWLVYSACQDEPLRGTNANVKLALAALERAIAGRTKIDLNDTKKDDAEKRKTALVSKSPGKAGGGGGGDAPSEAPTDAGATVDVPLTFEPVNSTDAFQRPCFDVDENYVSWRAIGLKGTGSSGTLEGLAEAPLFFRTGSADVRIDSDADGKTDGAADIKVALTGTIQPIKFNLGTGTSARPYALLGVTAGTQESYQGMSLNMNPTDSQLTLYVLGASSQVGTLDGQPIRILDETMDGQYGSVPQSYGFGGMSKGFYQPYLDCMLVGASKRARPWSEIAEVNGKWWKFEMGCTGKSIKASPIKTDTGTLKLEFKGPVAPSYLIVKGSGSFKDSYYDLVEGGAKGVQVPVGRYTIAYGEIRKGKKKQMQKCVIVAQKSPPNYDVTKGGTTVISLGAPFSFDFQSRNDDSKLTITGETISVVGSAGEHYERLWQCVVKPEAIWRKKGTKKAEKPIKLAHVVDVETMNRLGNQTAWFPLDLEITEVKGQGDVEVQLVDKKHDLFGKIESDWK